MPGLPDGIPIAGVAGDQQAALFGQDCSEPGDAKCTYGTGAFLLMNIGAAAEVSRRAACSPRSPGRWTRRRSRRRAYALEGSAFIAGALVQWLRDGLGLIAQAAEIEALARSVPDSGGVTIVPALAGLGAPHWRAGGARPHHRVYARHHARRTSRARRSRRSRCRTSTW